VRHEAVSLLCNLCQTRRLGQCRDLMLQLATSLIPRTEHETLASLAKMAANGPIATGSKPRFDEEKYMWTGLEKFIDVTKAVIFKEGL